MRLAILGYSHSFRVSISAIEGSFARCILSGELVFEGIFSELEGTVVPSSSLWSFQFRTDVDSSNRIISGIGIRRDSYSEVKDMF